MTWAPVGLEPLSTDATPEGHWASRLVVELAVEPRLLIGWIDGPWVGDGMALLGPSVQSF